MSETTETRPVLGDEVRLAAVAGVVAALSSPDPEREGVLAWVSHSGLGRMAELATDAVLGAIAPHVAALVTEAEARGAQAERKRIWDAALDADVLSGADIWSGQIPIQDLRTFVRQLLAGAPWPKCPRCGVGRLVKAELHKPSEYDCGHLDLLADLRSSDR